MNIHIVNQGGVGPLRLTPYSKRFIAATMFARGQAFLAAALLLRRENGYQYVVLHNLCQGIEVLLKGLLLIVDYDKFEPKLQRPIGHDLVRAARMLIEATDVNPLRPAVLLELKALNRLYSNHFLRYGNVHDLFIDPRTIPSDLVFRKVRALIKVIDRDYVGLLGVIPLA